MKIAIDCRHIGKSGIGTYIENIVYELVNNHPEHSYLMICHDEKQIGKHGDNVSIMKTNIKPFSLKELLFSPVKVINKCDVFFTPYINLPLGIKTPIYSTIHDVIFLDRRELTSKLGYLIRKMYLWNAIRMSKTIFTVSEFSKGRIVHHFRTDKPIVVTYNVVSAAIKEASLIEYRKAKSPYIIYVGNIKRHKGLKLLLEAYHIATKRGLHDKLYLVGSAEKFRTSDKELSRMIENTENVEFTGFLPNAELHKMIAEAKLLVLPSYYEGFGLTPLEGLYLGTDVLISDIDVLKEVYAELPVSYFKCGDATDLANKLLDFKPLIRNRLTVQKEIDKLYNASDIANKILMQISEV